MRSGERMKERKRGKVWTGHVAFKIAKTVERERAEWGETSSWSLNLCKFLSSCEIYFRLSNENNGRLSRRIPLRWATRTNDFPSSFSGSGTALTRPPPSFARAKCELSPRLSDGGGR